MKKIAQLAFILMTLFCISLSFMSSCLASDQLTLNRHLGESIRRGDLKDATYWLNMGADINYEGEYGLSSMPPAMWTAVRASPAHGFTPAQVMMFCHERGADIEARYNGLTPLMYACGFEELFGNPNSALLLMKLGADVNAVTDNGETALELFIKTMGSYWSSSRNKGSRAWIPVIKELIARGVHPNRAANDGTTPLILLARKSWPNSYDEEQVYIWLTKFLIQNGANPEARDYGKQWRAIDYAIAKNNKILIDLLMHADSIPRTSGGVIVDSPATTEYDINAKEINIGWLAPGTKLSYVDQVYGKPSDVIDADQYKIYNYNNLFIVYAKKIAEEFKVAGVECYEGNLTTPSGFKVGMPFNFVTTKLGEAKKTGVKNSAHKKQLKGCKEYTYFSGANEISFFVDKDEMIKGIRFGERNEDKLKPSAASKTAKDVLGALGQIFKLP